MSETNQAPHKHPDSSALKHHFLIGSNFHKNNLMGKVILTGFVYILLLDEPVAGIAPEMAERILAVIADLPNQGKSAIVIEHDIDALKGIVHRMIFMDAGRKICEGTTEDVLNDPRVVEAYVD